MPAQKILLIEDEADIRDVLNEILEMQGYLVTMVSNGLDGWKQASSNVYDMIITDLGIPGINGLDLVKRIRAAAIRTPVLIITGVIFNSSEIEIKNLYPCKVLVKPFKLEELLKIIVRETASNVHV